MAKKKPATPKSVSKAKAPRGKTPLDAMIEAGDKLERKGFEVRDDQAGNYFYNTETNQPEPVSSALGIDGNATDEPMRTVNQEWTIDSLAGVHDATEPVSNTDEHSVKDCNETDCPKCIAIVQSEIDQPEPVSSANPKTENNEKTDEKSDQDANESPQSPPTTTSEGEKNRGDIAIGGGSADSIQWPKSVESVPRARLPSEKRHAYWERMRKAARLAGLPRGQGPGSAYVWATEQAEQEFPYVVEELPAEPIAEIPEKTEIPSPDLSPIGDKTLGPSQPTDGSVSGLGNFPESWPKLPANAQLQQEIAWVTANRLLVRDGTGVNLSRAMSPPPSYSALSWLETSILFPAKFADISVKATAETDDEREHIKREKFAIEEIRSILKEMLDAKG